MLSIFQALIFLAKSTKNGDEGGCATATLSATTPQVTETEMPVLSSLSDSESADSFRVYEYFDIIDEGVSKDSFSNFNWTKNSENVEADQSSTVYMIRHGERQDESRLTKQMWKQQRTTENRHNPPLTDVGKLQARETALKWSEELMSADRWFVSPLLRTMETAAEMLHTLKQEQLKQRPPQSTSAVALDPYPAQCVDAIEIIPLPGLAECAAAVHKGEVALQPVWFPLKESLQNQLDLHLSRYVPWHSQATFHSTLNAICHAHKPGSTIVIIGHREGMRSLSERCIDEMEEQSRQSEARQEQKLIKNTPYCCLAKFTYFHDTETFQSHGIVSK